MPAFTSKTIKTLLIALCHPQAGTNYLFVAISLLLPFDPLKLCPRSHYNLMLSRRSTPKSQSIFFRGISLRQYVERSAQMHPPLQYKDDQTIFVDHEQRPVFVDDVFIYSDRSSGPRVETGTRMSWERSRDKGQGGLPMLHLRREGKEPSLKAATDRNSTDDSFPGEMDSPSLLLPQIGNAQRQGMVRERNITMASRSSSRSVSCRRRLIPPIPQNEELEGSGQTKEKRIAKGVCMERGDANTEVIRKKKEVMRAYSLVRNKRVGKGAVPIIREN